MDLGEKILQLKPAGMAAEEWSVRLELVACPSIPEAFTTYWTLQRAGIRYEDLL